MVYAWSVLVKSRSDDGNARPVDTADSLMTTKRVEFKQKILGSVLATIFAQPPVAGLSTARADADEELPPSSFFNFFSVDPSAVCLVLGSRRGIGQDSLEKRRPTPSS